MAIKGIAFVNYGVSNVAKSNEWYTKTLGLKETAHYTSPEGESYEYDIGPHTLTIGKWGEFEAPKGGAMAALEVDNFDAFLKDLTKKKVTVAMPTLDTGVCKMAIILDPDKNQIMIHQKK